MDIILASRSPRRRELLKKVLREFRVVPSRVREESIVEKGLVRFALRAAEAKARDVGQRHRSALIIAADTIVVVGRVILGKPRNRAEAEDMLRRLSGRRHRVITAVALYRSSDNRVRTGYETSTVTFRGLEDADIEAYLDQDDYSDKAGAYAIQDAGRGFVSGLQGDRDNVVGLPVKRLRVLLQEFLGRERSSALP